MIINRDYTPEPGKLITPRYSYSGNPFDYVSSDPCVPDHLKIIRSVARDFPGCIAFDADAVKKALNTSPKFWSRLPGLGVAVSMRSVGYCLPALVPEMRPDSRGHVDARAAWERIERDRDRLTDRLTDDMWLFNVGRYPVSPREDAEFALDRLQDELAAEIDFF